MLLTSGMRTIPRGTRGDGASALIGPCTTSTSQTGSNFPHQLALSMRHNRNKRAHHLKPSHSSTTPAIEQQIWGIVGGDFDGEKTTWPTLQQPCSVSALFCSFCVCRALTSGWQVSGVRAKRASECLACAHSGIASVWRA